MAQRSKRTRRLQNIRNDKHRLFSRNLPDCPTGKRRYPSEIVAQAKLEKLREFGTFAPGKTPKRMYACSKCRGWHTTSKEKREE